MDLICVILIRIVWHITVFALCNHKYSWSMFFFSQPYTQSSLDHLDINIDLQHSSVENKFWYQSDRTMILQTGQPFLLFVSMWIYLTDFQTSQSKTALSSNCSMDWLYFEHCTDVHFTWYLTYCSAKDLHKVEYFAIFKNSVQNMVTHIVNMANSRNINAAWYAHNINM